MNTVLGALWGSSAYLMGEGTKWDIEIYSQISIDINMLIDNREEIENTVSRPCFGFSDMTYPLGHM